ncbi:MAG: membrane protein insertase YidC [Simkaniaceae bacterium]
MTKRSLAFILLMTISFFGINYFLTSKHLKDERIQYENQQKTKEETAQKEKEALKAKIPPLSKLPIVSLQTNAEEGYQGIQFNGAYLVRTSSKTPPEQLFSDKNTVKKQFQADLAMPFTVYSGSEYPSIPAFKLPSQGSIELLLVTFNPESGSIDATIGQYENKRVYFPLNRPDDYSIALYQNGNEWLLAGFYDVEKNRFYSVVDLPKFKKTADFQKVQEQVAYQTNTEDSYYVLENDYQQLVFSQINGSLAEINLPFKNEENKKSVVRPIKFDKEIKQDSQSNARFPLHSYEIVQNGQKVAKDPQIGGYYPLLRRTLMGPGSRPYTTVPYRLYALNVLDDRQEDTLNFQLRKFEKDLIEFEAIDNNRRIIKTFSFPSDPNAAPYAFDVTIRIEGNARGLSLTSGVPEVELISGSYTPTLKYRMLRGHKSYVEKIKLPKDTSYFSSIHPDWICNSNGFFGIIMDPISEIGSGFTAQYISGNLDPTRLTLIDPQYHLYPAEKYPGYLVSLPLRESSQTMKFRVFAGPFATDILKRVDTAYTDPITGYNPNYLAAQSFHGWFSFISEPFAKFLFLLMQLFYKITHSWGLSIILLTIALRVMLYPLNTWSIKSNLRMQQVQPKVAALQEKYKKDPKRMQMEIMQLYRKEKANPFTGCLPILIQMPFLIGMFDLLKSNFDLRGAGFIPGWINNLTAPDSLFSWGYPIPFIGTEFHLLPILLGIVMYFQQKMSMRKQGAKATTDQQKQQKMMGNIFTVVFAVLFYNLPSGLNIYFLSSMGLQFLQQWYMTKKMTAANKAPASK